MDGNVGVERRNNPREGVNILSAFTYAWVVKIFRLGYKRDLELEDLYKPLEEHKSNIIGDELSAAWRNELDRCSTKNDNRINKPSLRRALFKVFGARIALSGLILLIMEVIVRVLQPLALGRFLRYFSDDNMPKTEAYLYATGILIATIVYTFLANPYGMSIFHTGMKMRVACCSLIYRKALKLSIVAMNDITIGEAVNLLSNDVGRFDATAWYFHYVWVGPLQTVVTTYFMYQEVGLAAIYGIIVLLIFVPFQLLFGRIMSILRLRIAIKTDERVRSTNEIIKGIQAIKMYTWEYLFGDIIKQDRNNEMSVIRYTTFIKSFVTSSSMYISRLSLFVTILIYVLSGNTVSSEKIFMLTAFYANLQQSMTMYFPYGISLLAESNVSIQRIQRFLMHSEFKSPYIFQVDNGNENLAYVRDVESNDKLPIGITNENVNESLVIFDNVHAKWLDNLFDGININIESGELVAIIGKVGSGKSSLLNVILKELPVTNGKIIVPDKISYASQEPWLYSASVQQNILFGRSMDHQKYQRVIEVCQLERDITLLPYGDKTIVGERGVSLSGGQKARINLARAVYSDASLYLLDDPLSAVDAHVGKLLFEQCIAGYLYGRTRILVTHQIQFLRNVKKIIVVDDGGVIATGTYDQLVNMGVDIGSLGQLSPDESKNKIRSYSRKNFRSSIVSSNSFPSMNDTEDQKQDGPQEVEETRTRGNVNRNHYTSYLRAGGNCCIIFIISFFYITAQLSASGADWFLAFWINLEENNEFNLNGEMVNSTLIISDELNTILSRNMCIYILSVLILLIIVLSIIRSFAFFELCMRASKRLHDAMFNCITRATMHFLNTNASGRILNRFTKDMGAIDELLPSTFIECIQIGLAALGIMVVVAISNPWLLIPTVFVLIVLYVLRAIYVATCRSVKRLEGITKSPMYSHFSATLQGLTTIRSFEAHAILTEEFDRHQDLHSSAWYLYIVSSRALAFWLECFNVIYTIIVTISFLLLPKNSDFSRGANVGLAITQCVGLSCELQWGIRLSAELDNQMTSVERVKEYANIEREPPLESSPDKKPPSDWPQEARIEFKNVYLSYGPKAPPALKNMNFTIKSRERVGIVGRTGAGKSSLISALFRLADVEGAITIDGIDTGEIGLHDLRSKISIIPQEPFLFSGSLRKNLDPFREYEDSELWAALEDVQLKGIGLELYINEDGTNLSVGQRQLVCLARAIVKRNKILVLDEATANVDSRTDELIQIIIKQKFSACTLLTIAHRLNTVMDSDRILVIDAGTVVEFDHPHVLLQNENGFLSNMVKETGDAMAEMLTTVAKENYEKRKLNSTAF